MKNWKFLYKCLFIVFCLALNYGGRILAAWLRLPLWLDSFGTVLCACMAGPVWGGLIGMAGNILYSMIHHLSTAYALTGLAMGVMVGIAARKNTLDTIFGTMTVSTVTTLTVIVISVPLSLIFYDGSTGNIWGDGVRAFMMERGVPALAASGIGQFYLDFMDKTLTLTVLHLALKLIRRIQSNREKAKAAASQAGKAACLLLAVSLALTAPPTASAEEAPGDTVDFNNYVQSVFSSKNGLPCGEANDIVETPDGILWVGTYAGLYRYNGREFRWMDYPSVRNVNCLYADGEGRLWIGTNDNGISIAQDGRVIQVMEMSHGLSSNSVRAIIETVDGYSYIGTTGSLQVMTLKDGALEKVAEYPEPNVNSIATDGAGTVAGTTSDGRLLLMKGAQILAARTYTEDQEAHSACCFSARGTLLVGTDGSTIREYDVSSGDFKPLNRWTCEGISGLKDLYPLDTGELFITSDYGVGYLDRQGAFHLVNTNDFNVSIDNMLMDYQGNLWFTSSRLGLLRMAPSAFQDIYGTVGLTTQVVNAVIKWQDAYYFGTDKGLDCVDLACRSHLTNALTEDLINARIRGLMVDANDHLWLCTYGQGLMEVAPDGTRYLYNRANGSMGDKVRMVFELSDGTVVAAENTGLNFIRDHQVLQTISYDEGLNTRTLTVTELPDGRLLAGTDGDGIAVIKEGRVEAMLTRENGLSSEIILRTVADPASGGVFIVTSNGLCYMDGTGSIRALKNFPYFNNYDLWIRDEKTMFVMSSAGIYVVDREELLADQENMTFELLDSRRGLNSSLTANSWNYFDQGKGLLFLPCDNGVFAIDPVHYADGAQAYRMMVTSVRASGAVVQPRNEEPITVSRSASRIEIQPEILNYTVQDPWAGYYLEGFDSDWTVLPQSALNAIVYTNLAPGSYTFHLAVFDNDQKTVLAQRSYPLVKQTEIYDRPWFMVYIILVPMIAVAWFTWFIVRTQLQRTLDIQKRELALANQQVQMGNEAIIAIAKAVDAKDERTSQHSARVSHYSVMIAKELGFSKEECESLGRTALMHDIGKIGIPDAILNKPDRLTDEEYAIMKSHTVRGADILKDFTLLKHVADGAKYHHERYDGKGYPNGLKGEEIPLNARIIGVADAFDAMTANRVYRKQMDFNYVFGEMRKGRGTQFDPQIVDVLLKLIDRGDIDLNRLYGVKPEAKPEEEKKHNTILLLKP